ncbi:hypothetical protein UYSO10_2865 [Kosakonia radicincitans]|uniref:hypothetical protein n=1 Tax=Kosakonia radicincitans TaxID=283686 RepID=UPI001183A4BB|nr:hypothetical protein [Kosakonia radicincitans]VVT49526.1 hypothetical protein UYSO10_2865 [Kosakonia radicincitans]
MNDITFILFVMGEQALWKWNLEGAMWVNYAGDRRAYMALQGRLRNVVDHILAQHNLFAGRVG